MKKAAQYWCSLKVMTVVLRQQAGNKDGLLVYSGIMANLLTIVTGDIVGCGHLDVVYPRNQDISEW